VRGGKANDDTGTTAAGWTNINAFAARLTAAAAVDFSVYGIWAMRSALETPIDALPADEVPAALQAASAWLQLAGRPMHDSEQRWARSPQHGDPARGGPLYEGPPGFCAERWALWRARLRVLASDDRLDAKTAQMLRAAATAAAAL
jgi:hypothetical protein